MVFEIIDNRLKPGSREETVCIGCDNPVILGFHYTVISCSADLFACLDEHLVRILCGNLAGVVLRVSVNNDYFVLVAGKRLVADTL